jgi:diguanylate cyclase (GGDEF)-like protein
VNDTLGHAAGDAVLRELAARLASATRDSDTVARFGGDEFVILTEVADEEGAHRFAQRIRQAIVTPLLIDGRTHRITASIGVALAHAGIEDSDALLRAADQALYRAKRSGRDGIHAAAADGPQAANG